MEKSRRGAVLIEPFKQLKFGLMFLLLNFVFAALVLTIFGYYLWDIYQALIRYFQLDEAQSLVTMDKLEAPFMAAILLLVLFILTTLLFSVHYTHRIYGPLVSIRRFLDQMLRGENPEPMQIRSRDQLQDLVGRLNAVAQQQAKFQKMGSIAAVNQYIEALIQETPPQTLQVAKSDPLHEVVVQLERLHKKLASAPTCP